MLVKNTIFWILSRPIESEFWGTAWFKQAPWIIFTIQADLRNKFIWSKFVAAGSHICLAQVWREMDSNSILRRIAAGQVLSLFYSKYGCGHGCMNCSTGGQTSVGRSSSPPTVIIQKTATAFTLPQWRGRNVRMRLFSLCHLQLQNSISQWNYSYVYDGMCVHLEFLLTLSSCGYWVI